MEPEGVAGMAAGLSGTGPVMIRRLVRGAAAGAAGTTALNAVTYLDMGLRGRPSSSTPEDSVEKIAHRLGTDIPGAEAPRQNRLQGLGALTGIATGIAVGALYGLLEPWVGRGSVSRGAAVAGLGAMAGTIAPMAALEVSDPRSWGFADWASDAVPHAAYGVVTAAAYHAIAT